MSLGANNSSTVSCRVCRREADFSFRHLLLGLHQVNYFQCRHCGLLQTGEPHWLQAAYEQPIAERDTGIVERNLHLANITAALAWHLFGPSMQGVDAAGGYGLFTRLMRDRGFDFYWHDQHSPNLLARGFEIPAEATQLQLVSAFEVLEHLTDPVGFLREWQVRAGCNTFLMTTELFEGNAPAADWWYYLFDTGQHISFYQRRTLQAIAGQLGLRLYSRRHIHVFTDQPLSDWRFRVLTGRRSARWLAAWPRFRMPSRIWTDSQLLATRAVGK